MNNNAYEELLLGWSAIIEGILNGENYFDLDRVKHLIFDSYHYH